MQPAPACVRVARLKKKKKIVYQDVFNVFNVLILYKPQLGCLIYTVTYCVGTEKKNIPYFANPYF